MEFLPAVLVAIVALEHVYILYLEMFAWTKPSTRKAFGISKEEAETSKVLAANQGLYNGFLAAGLAWGLLHPDASIGEQIQLFFVSCVAVAAIYGGLTANKRILLVQGMPALLALAALLLI